MYCDLRAEQNDDDDDESWGKSGLERVAQLMSKTQELLLDRNIREPNGTL